MLIYTKWSLKRKEFNDCYIHLKRLISLNVFSVVSIKVLVIVLLLLLALITQIVQIVHFVLTPALLLALLPFHLILLILALLLSHPSDILIALTPLENNILIALTPLENDIPLLLVIHKPNTLVSTLNLRPLVNNLML